MPKASKFGLLAHASTIYAASAASVCVALIAYKLLEPWMGGRPFPILFIMPIAFSARIGGFRAGLFATLLSAAATAYFTLPPRNTFAFDDAVDVIHWSVLLASGIAVSVFARGKVAAVEDEPESAAAVDRTLLLTEWKVRGGFALALGCLGVVGMVGFVRLESINRAADWVAHTEEALWNTRLLIASIGTAEAQARGYLVDDDPLDWASYEESMRGIDTDLSTLRVLTRDNSIQHERLETIGGLIATYAHELTAAEYRRGPAAPGPARWGEASGRLAADRKAVLGLANDMAATETALLRDRRSAEQRRLRTTEAIIVGGGVIAYGFVALILLRLRADFSRRLRTDASMRLRQSDLEARVLSGTVEVERSDRELKDEITRRRDAQHELRAHIQRLDLLQRITRAIAERQDLASIFSVVTDTLGPQMPVDFCAICTLDRSDGHAVVRSVHGWAPGMGAGRGLAVGSRIPIGETRLRRWAGGEVIYDPDLRQVALPFQQSLARDGPMSLVSAALQVENHVIGLLLCARRKAEGFSGSECEFIRQLSEHVALAGHQAQLYEALQTAYQNLRRTQQAMLQEERLKALGQMASGIAHDVNNAISPVTLYLESVLEDETGLSPRGRRHLEIIHRAVTDVSQTVGGLLDFSRTREAQTVLSPVNLNQVVASAVDLTRARWFDMPRERAVLIEVRTDLAQDLPAIMGVTVELRDAVTNLIFNAVDAMPQGGVLTLRTRLLRESRDGTVGNLVGLEVSDTGIGMDAETRRRCIEPFFTTKGERGTGLGLAQVYGAMQRHGSDFEVDSLVGRGTVFQFSFPIASVRAAEMEEQGVPAVLPLDILVIDDDVLVATAVREILEKDGHRVTIAVGGQAGIDAFAAAREQGTSYPAVITDLGMPFVDGHAVAAAVKALDPMVVVVLLTGWGRRAAEESALPPHVEHVLSKPPKRSDLRLALARAVRQSDAKPTSG